MHWIVVASMPIGLFLMLMGAVLSRRDDTKEAKIGRVMLWLGTAINIALALHLLMQFVRH